MPYASLLGFFLWAVNTIQSPCHYSWVFFVCFLIESAFYFFKWRIFPSGILTLHLHFLCVLQEILTGWGMTSPRMLAQALLSTKQTRGTTRASSSNSRMCLRGTGTRPTPEACSPPSSPTAQASSDSDSPQAKLPRAAQVGRTPRVCSLKEQTYGTSCVSHLYIYIDMYTKTKTWGEKNNLICLF